MDLDPRDLVRRLDVARPRALGPVVDGLSESWARRGPRLRRTVVVAGVVGAVVAATVTGRSPGPPPVEVWVATRDGGVGEPVAPLVAVTRRDPAVVPDGAVPATDAAAGRLSLPVLGGQVLTDRHLVEDLTSLLRTDEVALPVRGDQLAPATSGAEVDVLTAGGSDAGRLLASSARILHVTDAWWWLAVPAAVAPAVAAADADGRLTLARRPPPVP